MRLYRLLRTTFRFMCTVVCAVLISGCTNKPGSGRSEQRPALLAWETATLSTPFAPPFDRVRLERSGRSTAASEFIPNLHFDMEQSTIDSLLSDSMSYTGSRSFHLGANREYSPTIEQLVSAAPYPITSVALGMWMYTDTLSGRLTMVAELQRDGIQVAWHGKDIDPRELKPDSWNRCQAEFDLGAAAPAKGDIIRVYIWNGGHGDLHIDDMDVVFRGSAIPGKRSGSPYDTEDPGDRPAPPAFAQLMVDKVVDPAASGVVPGGPLPAGSGEVLSIALYDGTTFHKSPDDAIGYLKDRQGRNTQLIRAWCSELGLDLFGFERILARTVNDRVMIIGYDLDVDPLTGSRTVARSPLPRGVLCRIVPSAS